MTPEEFARARRLIRGIAVAAAAPAHAAAAPRPARDGPRRARDSPAGRSRRAATRCCARSGAAAETPRKLVLLLDVSGSMESYSRALLLYLHAAPRLRPRRRDVRVRHASHPDHARARAPATPTPRSPPRRSGSSTGPAARASAPSLKAYNDEWGRRALTRGAVVVILSDGCERGDPALVAAEMARLARQAFAVVWVNPLKGARDYEPLARRDAGSAAVDRPASSRATTSRASRRSAASSAASTAATRR